MLIQRSAEARSHAGGSTATPIDEWLSPKATKQPRGKRVRDRPVVPQFTWAAARRMVQPQLGQRPGRTGARHRRRVSARRVATKNKA